MKRPTTVPMKPALKRQAAVLKKPAGDEYKEYRDLQMLLVTWANRKYDGAAALLEECQNLGTCEEKMSFLKKHVDRKEGRGPRIKIENTAATISKHTQADSVTFSTMKARTVTKSYPTNSVATLRTLSVYAYLRETNQESEVPLPRLFKVEKQDKQTIFTFQCSGQDYSVYQPISYERFIEAKQKSQEELMKAGIHQRISNTYANWALIRQGASWRVILLDVGRCCVSKKGRRAARPVQTRIAWEE